MKKMIFAAFAALLTIGCTKPAKDKKQTITDTFPQEMEYTLSREDTINAMALAFAKQESNFKHDAVSPCGRWVGCLQISKICVAEANRIVGEQIFFAGSDCYIDDRLDKQGSYAIFKTIQEHHNPNLDIDKAINIWNKLCTDEYRQKVKKYFEYNLLNYNKLENFFEL